VSKPVLCTAHLSRTAGSAVKKTVFLQLSQLSQLLCINLGLFAQFAKVAKVATIFFSLMILQLRPQAGRVTPCAPPFWQLGTWNLELFCPNCPKIIHHPQKNNDF
jgi:hypothetical protein